MKKTSCINKICEVYIYIGFCLCLYVIHQSQLMHLLFYLLLCWMKKCSCEMLTFILNFKEQTLTANMVGFFGLHFNNQFKQVIPKNFSLNHLHVNPQAFPTKFLKKRSKMILNCLHLHPQILTLKKAICIYQNNMLHL